MADQEIIKVLAEFMGYRYSDLLEAIFIDGQEPIPWNPLENISDAWELFEKLPSGTTLTKTIQGYLIDIIGLEESIYDVVTQRAICMAVIKVIENGDESHG